MHVENTTVIQNDMTKVMANRHTEFSSTSLREYFDRTITRVVPLANSAGELYLNELADFMTCTLLPSDGSWVKAVFDKAPSQKEYKDMEKMLEHLRRQLAASNFYGKMQEMVIQGLIYNRGVISTSYTSGLTFDIHDARDTHTTNEADEFSNRCYIEKIVSLPDLFNTYEEESIPEHIREKYKNFKETGTDEPIVLVIALLPNRAPYTSGGNSNYKYVEVTFINESELYEIKKKTGGVVGYNYYPLCQFHTGMAYSLAHKALPDAMMVNKYEQMFYDQGSLITYPPMALSSETVARGAYDLGPKGQVPLNNHERKPEPIIQTGTMNVSEATIAKKEQRLREIFKIDLINRVKITNVSQAEYYQNMYTVLKSIQPMAMNLVYRTVTQLLKRAHKLLMDNDSKYKALAIGGESLDTKKLEFDHLGALLKKASTMSQLGRFGQAAQFYLQVDPDAAVTLDVEKVLSEAANTLGIPQILKDKREADAERKARADAAQQAQLVDQQAALNQGGQDGGGANQAGGAQGGAPGGAEGGGA